MRLTERKNDTPKKNRISEERLRLRRSFQNYNVKCIKWEIQRKMHFPVKITPENRDTIAERLYLDQLHMHMWQYYDYIVHATFIAVNVYREKTVSVQIITHEKRVLYLLFRF